MRRLWLSVVLHLACQSLMSCNTLLILFYITQHLVTSSSNSVEESYHVRRTERIIHITNKPYYGEGKSVNARQEDEVMQGEMRRGIQQRGDPKGRERTNSAVALLILSAWSIRLLVEINTACPPSSTRSSRATSCRRWSSERELLRCNAKDSISHCRYGKNGM